MVESFESKCSSSSSDGSGTSLSSASTSRFFPETHLDTRQSLIEEQLRLATGHGTRKISCKTQLTSTEDEIPKCLPDIHGWNRDSRAEHTASKILSNQLHTHSRTSSAKPKKTVSESGSSIYPIAGFFSKLSQIPEGREQEPTRRHSRVYSSNIGKDQEHHSRRKRSGDVTDVDRRGAASLTNSSGSSGSSTVIQRSYDRSIDQRRRYFKHRKPTQDGVQTDKGRVRLRRSKEHHNDSMDPPESQVEAAQGEATIKSGPKPHSRPSSSASSSEDENPPRLASIPEKRRSLPPSPSSSYMSKNLRRRQDTFNSDSGISVSSSPEVHSRLEQPSSAQKSDLDSDAESSSDSNEVDSSTRPCPTARSSSVTVIGANSQPKALPDSDTLVQRLREQEEEMRLHLDLHSPRPQRTIRPQVTSSYEPSPVLPLFDYRATSTAPPNYSFPPHAPVIPQGDSNFLHPQYSHSMQHHMPHVPPFEFDPTKNTLAGYEMLASKLAEQSQDNASTHQPWHPVYRKFAQLNHRVLLHLQDEISEMEEELRILDESIAQMTAVNEDDQLLPSSRRAETRFGSELHYRRTEVLGRVFVKLGQYNQALSSYSTATSNFPPAQKNDVSAYRSWMEENAPIDEEERRFLTHEQDLMAMRKRSSAPEKAPVLINLRQDKLILFAVLLPPIAISLVSGFIAKIVVIGVLACAAVLVLESRGVGIGIGSGLSDGAGHVEMMKEESVEKSIMRS